MHQPANRYIFFILSLQVPPPIPKSSFQFLLNNLVLFSQSLGVLCMHINEKHLTALIPATALKADALHHPFEC